MLKHLFNHNKAGFYKGKHYTAYVDEVRALKRDENLTDAEPLLLGLIDAVEAEAGTDKSLMAPWYTEQLAIVYHKLQRYADEVAILERYDQHAKGHVFANRLVKARALALRSA